MGSGAAQVAEVEEGMASALLRGLAERTAAREQLRAQEYEEDREWTRQGDAYYARFQEGYLCKLMSSGFWTLFLVWPDQSTRVLIHGRRKSIERYAQEVLCYGPPGGPDYQGGALDWRASDDDATIRAATIGGELRLMPWEGGQHLLLLVQNDYGVAVLGRGLRAVLLRTAEKLLDERSADTLHLRIADERINLHGLGSASVVGYLDLQHGGQFVLGPVDGGDFGLFYQLGEYTRTVGVYTLAEVRRGDLGRTFAWCSNAGPIGPLRQSGVAVPRASEVALQSEVSSAHPPSPEVPRPTPPHEVPSATPEVACPMPEDAGPAPPDIPTPSGAAVMPPLDDGTSRQPGVAAHRPSAGMSALAPTRWAAVRPGAAMTSPPEASSPLADQDLRLVERHLTLEDEPTGGGATAVPLLLKGLYRLVALGLGDQLLRAQVLRSLLAKRFGIHFDCAPRTFRRALLAVAAHTHLLRKVGHRWHLGIGELQRQDSELLRWIRAVTPPDTEHPEGASREATPGSTQSAALERLADHDTPPPTAARVAHPVPQASMDHASGHERSGPTAATEHEVRPLAPAARVAEREVPAPTAAADPIADPSRIQPPAPTDRIADHERVPTHGSAASAEDTSIHPRNVDTGPDRRAYTAATDPAPNDETPASPRWGYQRRLRTDGKPTVWRRRWEPLPAEQSASRFPGKKGRGPPRS